MHVCRHPGRRLGPWLAAAVGGLIVVGCAQAHDPGSTPAAPAPVSQEAYQTELRAAGNALKTAFDGIKAAPPLEPLGTQIDSAASTVRTTTQRFANLVPPAQYAAGQAALVLALDQLANQLAGLSSQVQSRALCAAPSAMVTLSALDGAEALRRAASALGPEGITLAAALPTPEPLSDRRESNGKILRSPGSGKGLLKVDNNTEHDVAVTLSQNEKTIGSLYVRQGETAQMAGIPDGNYDIYFATGSDWDGGVFTRSCTYEHVEKTWTFTTEQATQGRYKYTTVQLKLRGGPDANVPLVDVPPSSFPK